MMSKLKSLSLFLLISLSFFPFHSEAQTPLTEGGGPVVENCNAKMSDKMLLRNDDKSAIFYMHTYSTNPKLQYQGIVTYNKQTNTSYAEKIIAPDGYRPLYVRAIGNDYYGYYYRFNREKHAFEYSIAQFPQKKSTDGIRNINPESRLAIDLTGRGEVLKYVAVSPDETKFAITFIAPNDRNQAPYFYCYVYDNTGKEIWYDKFLPTIEGNKFTIHDLQLSDKAELFILVNAIKGKNESVQHPTLQLFKCKHQNITSVSEELDYGLINSMKMLRLKSGDIFIGGYYNASIQTNTTGWFNYTVKEDPLRITAKNHEAFSNREDIEYEGFTNKDYLLKCDYLYELKDKIILMMGEQYTSVQTNGDKSSIAFTHHTNDIYCHKFTLAGTDLGLIKVNKHLSAHAADVLTTHDEGERIGGYLINAKKPFEKNPTFESLCLSYRPIQMNNEMYVMYADKFSNFDENNNDWDAANVDKGDEMCVVLTKIDYSVDKKMVMAPNKNAAVFHDIWLIDGQDIYFGMSGKKSYTIEKFKLNKQWNWDK
ncbi:MAG: hypothetical protein IJ986_07665 [Bacteroidales bacterium]|nr:hypothetical protein [Bacteroidales bacterium]